MQPWHVIVGTTILNSCSCGDFTPYQPKGICSPMQPINSCLNCYPRGRPLTEDEIAEQNKRNEEGLKRLGELLEG